MHQQEEVKEEARSREEAQEVVVCSKRRAFCGTLLGTSERPSTAILPATSIANPIVVVSLVFFTYNCTKNLLYIYINKFI